jgi:hypothetical protein
MLRLPQERKERSSSKKEIIPLRIIHGVYGEYNCDQANDIISYLQETFQIHHRFLAFRQPHDETKEVVP